MKITEKKLRLVIREVIAKLNESPRRFADLSDVAYASQGNLPPPRDSNWFEFANEMDMGTLDLDGMADDLGYANFLDMDASISPADLADRNNDLFVAAIKNNSLMASDMGRGQILGSAGARGGGY